MILHFQPSAPGTGVARIGATEAGKQTGRKPCLRKRRRVFAVQQSPHITERFVELTETHHAARLIEDELIEMRSCCELDDPIYHRHSEAKQEFDLETKGFARTMTKMKGSKQT